MDIIDYKTGINKHNFYFKAKCRLLDSILSKIRKKDVEILCIGAGTGEELEVLNNYGKITVIDINKEALDLIPKKLYKEKIVMDATNLKFKKEKFDIVCALDVIEHIKDDKKAIEEIKRVLKKGGNSIILVPAFNWLYSSHDKALGHHRRYNKKDLIELIKEFKILKISFWNMFLFPPISIIRIIKKNQKKQTTDNFNFNKNINSILFRILNFENKLIKKINLPFGLSILVIAKK